MPSYTGAQLARGALREIGVLDPTEDGSNELLNDAITVATDLIDEWRTSRLTISGVTRTAYTLTNGTQNYTIGTGGAFNQDWPTDIEYWSRIPDRTAANPVEQPMGRPLTYDQWQQVRVKSLTASYPNKMYYDRAWVAGLGTVSFHPIQNSGNVQAVLYSFIAAITAIVSGTTYNLRPAVAMAFKTNLAVELLDGRFKRAGDWTGLYRRASRSLAALKRHNRISTEAPMRAEFAIGTRGRSMNIYTGGR